MPIAAEYRFRSVSDERTRFVTVRGARLHLREYGEAGELPPVILLHGWPQHGGIWSRIAPELARERRVLVPDLRGFGRSDAPPGTYAKHEFAADIVALLDAEGIDRAAIVGHDWGAWTAWLIALEHPARVERFAGVDIKPPWRFHLPFWRFPLAALFAVYQVIAAMPWLGERAIGTPAFTRLVIRAGSAPGMRWDPADLDSYALQFTDPTKARAAVRVYRTFLLRELPALARDRYTSPDLTVPALMVWGSQSPLKLLVGGPGPGPNLRVETISGAGHFIPDEKPAELLALLRPFLAEGALSSAP